MVRVQRAPDGGWGWVVVLVSFTFHMLMGFVYAMNVLYGAWLDEFEQGRGVTSWIVAFFNTMQVLMGPVSASFAAKCGHKVVSFVGSVMMGIGFFLSFFSTNIVFLLFSVGFIAGIGSGLCYIPLISAVTSYFEKKRALAVGFATSGVGVGTFVMPPIMIMLEEMYTWRGVMLILSGALLQLCILSLLLRPLPYSDDEGSSLESESEKECLVNENTFLPSIKNVTVITNKVGDSDNELVVCAIEQVEPEEAPGLCNSTKDSHKKAAVTNSAKVHSSLSNLVLPDENTTCTKPKSSSTKFSSSSSKHSPFYSEVNISTDVDKENKALSQQGHAHVCMTSELLLRKEYLRDNPVRNRSTSMGIPHPPLHPLAASHETQPFSSAQELTRRSSTLSRGFMPENGKEEQRRERRSNLSLMLAGSLYNIVALEPHLNSMLSVESKASGSHSFANNAMIDRTSVLSSLNYVNQDLPTVMERPADADTPSKQKNLRIYVDLMKNYQFILIAMSNMLFNLSYLTPVIYMVDRAIENDVPKASASFALSMFGAGNLFGRIGTGVFADRNFVSHVNLYTFFLTACGVITCLSVFCGSNAVMHSVYGFTLGYFLGSYVTLTPVVLVDFLGLELVGHSYGLCLLFMGVSMVVGTPMAGWIFDGTGSYTISFVVHGLFFLLAAFLIVPLSVMSYRTRRNEKSEIILAVT